MKNIKSVLFSAFILLVLMLSCKPQQKDQPIKETPNENDSATTTLTEKAQNGKTEAAKFKYQSSSAVAKEVGAMIDALFSCNNFIYDEDYFRMPDYGCPYNPKYNKDNQLGWADVLLVIKEKDKSNMEALTENDLYDLEDEVSSLSQQNFDSIKNRFRPIVFLIEKEYLAFNEAAELQYYPKLPYVKKLYSYQDNGWQLLDTLKVTSELEDYKWVDKNITNLIR